MATTWSRYAPGSNRSKRISAVPSSGASTMASQPMQNVTSGVEDNERAANSFNVAAARSRMERALRGLARRMQALPARYRRGSSLESAHQP